MNIFNIKKYFIYILPIFVCIFFFTNNAYAQSTANIVYETDPLFSDLNILPGDQTTKWVRVENNLDEDLFVDVVVNSYEDSDLLASQMNISIDSGLDNYYNDSLSNFFADSGAHLANLSPGESGQYDFTIRFNNLSGNSYQGKSLSFDISISVSGEDSGTSEIVSSSGGRSGYFVEDEVPVVKGEEGFPQLSIAKKSSLELVNPGDSLEYRIDIKNNGDLTAFNVILNDRLPDGFYFSSNQGTEKTWNLGNIEAGEYRSVSYLVDVSGDLSPGVYNNLASVFATNNDRIETSDSVEVASVEVLGLEYELPASGFSFKEFAELLFLLLVLISFRVYLKKYKLF